MKKILVLVVDYPNNEGNTSMMFVHIRNKYYEQHGIDVTVLSFNARKSYLFEGIKVINLSSYKDNYIQYDTLVVHAPNVKNHYRFLKAYEERFQHIIFFFHGHEVLKINEVYPKPYSYMEEHIGVKKCLQALYDCFKLKLWHKYLPRLAVKSDFVFVSHSLLSEFRKYTKLSDTKLKNKIHIICNSVGSAFEKNNYLNGEKKEYDFITIRSNIDSSVYCIDLVCRIAGWFPDKKFLLIGQGKWFEYNKKPSNLIWINQKLSHEELLKYIDKAKVALMPTRRDTQGVMSCELVTYGIPLITSDLSVCKEMFADIENVKLISNKIERKGLEHVFRNCKNKDLQPQIDLFTYSRTVLKEERLIKEGRE